MVVATMQALLPAQASLTGRRHPVACRAHLQDPIRAGVLAMAAGAAPELPWEVHADDHLVVHNVW
eukprot:8457923-Lingulodinium_polyedra.AAC.1